MADKDQDIRNKIVDCSTCPNVQIYENETVIFFQVEGQELRVVQKGTITMQYKDGTVVFYENGVLLFEACSVENIRKANNDIYAETYLELVVALSAFLGFSSGGGGGIANVANGLFDDGGTAKLGGNLVEDTTVLGSNIYSLIFAFLDNFIAQGDVLQLLATSLVDVSSDDAINVIATGILQLTSANQINIDSSGAIRLTSNANEVSINGNSLLYFGDSTSDGSFRIGISGGTFIVEQRILGVWTAQSFSVIANNGLNFSGGAVKLGGTLLADTTISGLFQLIFSGLSALRFGTDIVQQQSTGFYYFGNESTDGSLRIGLVGGNFAIQKRILGVYITQSFYNPAASNGLNVSGGDVKLGGALTANTTISGLFDFILSGLAAFRINTDIVEQQSTGKYVYGGTAIDGSIRIGVSSGAFAIEKRIAGIWTAINTESEAISTKKIGNVLKTEIAFSFDISSIAATTFATLALDADSQYAFNLTGIAIRTASNGNASYQSIGGVRRTVLGNTVSGTASTIQLESLAGTLSISSVLVGNSFEFRATSSVATKTRFEGILTIQKTTIIDNF